MCAKSGHYPKDCSSYPTPEKKMDRVKSLELCQKCARKKHNGRCFNLSRSCRKCSKWHFDYMCVAQPKNSKGKTKESKDSKPKNSQSSTSIDSVSSSVVLPVNDRLDRDILLPTFTANLRGPTLQAKVRSVYDPWSQTTFINESLAQKLHCKVLHNIDLTVKGFNSKRKK